MGIDVSPERAGALFQEFVRIIKALRTPETGCPWDLEQTRESIRRYLVEEMYEVLDAIDAQNDGEIALELGDVLLQVVLHSQIAADRDAFDITSVIQNISDKMVRRHPHVFGEVTVEGTAEVLRNWEKIKLLEKTNARKEGESRLLDGVPRSLPALIRAQRLGEKAAKVNFDWQSVGDVMAKLQEEAAELSVEVSAGMEQRTRIEEELGDLLFAAAQLARHCDLSAEDALARAGDRFQRRFAAVETKAGEALSALSAKEMELLWESVKEEERK